MEQTQFNSTGNVGGSTANATLSTAQLASHSHPGGAGGGNPSAPSYPQVGSYTKCGCTGTVNGGSGTGHSHNMSATFTGDATSVLQPYLTIIYIIKNVGEKMASKRNWTVVFEDRKSSNKLVMPLGLHM